MHAASRAGSPLGSVSPAITSVLGAPPADVRVHTDAHAAEVARSHDAAALTIGTDIYYGASAARPGSRRGDSLLAHELAHVAQQRGATGPTIDLSPSARHETNADDAVARVVGQRAGYPLRGTWQPERTGLRLQRQPVDAGVDATLPDAAPPISEKDKRLAQNKARRDALRKVKGARSFSEEAAAETELIALDHWIAVDETGKGVRTGVRSGEDTSGGLAQCSCTSYVRDVLAHTFAAGGKKDTWKKIIKTSIALNDDKSDKGLNGIELQRALISEDGWKAIFWARDPLYKSYQRHKRNPDHSYFLDTLGNEVWEHDSEPQDRAPKATRAKDPTYYKMPVSAAVVNYHPEAKDPTVGKNQWTPVDSTTRKDTTTLDKLRKIPFGVLTMYGGDHMALLIHGVVYEVHWDEESTSPGLYEAKDLEDYGWHTGAVVVPASELTKAFGKP